MAADVETLIRRIDGFHEPQGLCLLPAEVRAAAGYDVVVADTVDHRLRGLSLATGEVTVLAGTLRQWRSNADDGIALSSPWDLAWYDGRVIVAMAGIHQLWWFDPIARTTGVYDESMSGCMTRSSSFFLI